MPKVTSQRTFTACWTCRKRGLRCDTKQPSCTQCSRVKVECEGYDLRLVWVDPKTGVYQPENRRAYPCELTWKGCRTWSNKEVGHLITFAETKRCLCPLHHVPSPFGMLDLGEAIYLPQSPEPDLEDEVIGNLKSPTIGTSDHELACVTPQSSVDMVESCTAFVMDFDLFSPASLWSPTIPWVPNGSSEENDLFHHYISVLAPVMTPIDDESNPWNSTYPRLAIQLDASSATRSLFHAILAQSAFHRANLSQASAPKFLRVGTNNYVLALRHLRLSLNGLSKNFTTTLAAMLTVTIAGHCFQGQSIGLAQHLQGAVRYVMQYLEQRPWDESNDTWVVTQSFALQTLISQTSRPACLETIFGRSVHRDDDNTANDTLAKVLADLTVNPNFAYTIGSTPLFMKALCKVRQLELDLARQQHREITGDRGDDACGQTSDQEQTASGPSHPRLSTVQFIQVSNIFAELNAPLHRDIDLYLCRQRERWQQQRAVVDTSSLEHTWRRRIEQNLHLFRSSIEIYLFRTVLHYPPSAVAKQVLSTLQTASELLEPLDRAASVSIWPIFIAAVEAYEPEAQALAGTALQLSMTLGAANRKTAHEVVQAVWAQREQIANQHRCHLGDVQIDWREVLRGLNVDILLL
jgi:hypothetical protein